MTNSNKWLWAAGIAAFVLTTVVIYVPFLSAAFEFEHISFMEYGIAIALGALMIPLVEIVKFIQRKAGKGNVK